MDITMCTAEGCNIKEECLRYKGKRNTYYQSIFTEPPFVIHNDKQICDHFIEFNLKKDENNN